MAFKNVGPVRGIAFHLLNKEIHIFNNSAGDLNSTFKEINVKLYQVAHGWNKEAWLLYKRNPLQLGEIYFSRDKGDLGMRNFVFYRKLHWLANKTINIMRVIMIIMFISVVVYYLMKAGVIKRNIKFYQCGGGQSVLIFLGLLPIYLLFERYNKKFQKPKKLSNY